MIETFFAGLTLAVCLLLALRLAIGRSRRLRLDGWVRRRSGALRRGRPRLVARRKLRRSSAEAADAAIRRARGGRWDGNVYRPHSFRRPRKPH